LAFDIDFALPRSPIKGLRWALTEDERRALALSIVEHLKLCGWRFEMTPIVVGQGDGEGRVGQCTQDRARTDIGGCTGHE